MLRGTVRGMQTLTGALSLAFIVVVSVLNAFIWAAGMVLIAVICAEALDLHVLDGGVTVTHVAAAALAAAHRAVFPRVKFDAARGDRDSA